MTANILLVENREQWITNATEMITEAAEKIGLDFEIKVVTDFAEADELLRGGRSWQLVVTDLQGERQEVPGLGLVRIARQKGIPCVAISGAVPRDASAMAVEMGAKFFNKDRWFLGGAERFVNAVVNLLQSCVNGDRARVFLSYSRRNRGAMEEIKRCLTARGLCVWVDEERIPAAAEWEKRIREGIDASRVALLLLSKPYLESDFIMNDELMWILEARSKRRIEILWVPVGQAQRIPGFIRKLQAAHSTSLARMRRGQRHAVLAQIADEVASVAERPARRGGGRRVAMVARTPHL